MLTIECIDQNMIDLFGNLKVHLQQKEISDNQLVNYLLFERKKVVNEKIESTENFIERIIEAFKIENERQNQKIFNLQQKLKEKESENKNISSKINFLVNFFNFLFFLFYFFFIFLFLF